MMVCVCECEQGCWFPMRSKANDKNNRLCSPSLKRGAAMHLCRESLHWSPPPISMAPPRRRRWIYQVEGEPSGWGGSQRQRVRGGGVLRRKCPGVLEEQLYGSSTPATCPWNRPASAGRRRSKRWPRWFLEGERRGKNNSSSWISLKSLELLTRSCNELHYNQFYEIVMLLNALRSLRLWNNHPGCA